MTGNLILILGDQLHLAMSSLQQADKQVDVILMAEVSAEATYVRHHQKKLAFVFSAMRHFAEELRAAGWRVDYTALDDPANTGTLELEVARAKARHGLKRVMVTEPGEWRLLSAMQDWPDTDLLPDDRFLASRAEFAEWVAGRKGLRMEHFYRVMRRKSGLLMEGDQPAGGKWNLDAENRNRAPDDMLMPQPKRFAPDEITQDVLALVKARFGNHFGTLEPFWFGPTRDQAEAAFEHFVQTALPQFGTYQDAMLQN